MIKRLFLNWIILASIIYTASGQKTARYVDILIDKYKEQIDSLESIIKVYEYDNSFLGPRESFHVDPSVPVGVDHSDSIASLMRSNRVLREEIKFLRNRINYLENNIRNIQHDYNLNDAISSSELSERSRLLQRCDSIRVGLQIANGLLESENTVLSKKNQDQKIALKEAMDSIQGLNGTVFQQKWLLRRQSDTISFQKSNILKKINLIDSLSEINKALFDTINHQTDVIDSISQHTTLLEDSLMIALKNAALSLSLCNSCELYKLKKGYKKYDSLAFSNPGYKPYYLEFRLNTENLKRYFERRNPGDMISKSVLKFELESFVNENGKVRKVFGVEGNLKEMFNAEIQGGSNESLKFIFQTEKRLGRTNHFSFKLKIVLMEQNKLGEVSQKRFDDFVFAQICGGPKRVKRISRGKLQDILLSILRRNI